MQGTHGAQPGLRAFDLLVDLVGRLMRRERRLALGLELGDLGGELRFGLGKALLAAVDGHIVAEVDRLADRMKHREHQERREQE